MSTNNNQNIVNFTDDAANKVAELILEEENPDLKLRVYITGGGCSGLQYGFSFEENINDDDEVITKKIDNPDLKQVTLLIDALSLQYLENADIDYVDDIDGARFVIRNPNAKTTCGCGSSFSD